MKPATRQESQPLMRVVDVDGVLDEDSPDAELEAPGSACETTQSLLLHVAVDSRTKRVAGIVVAIGTLVVMAALLVRGSRGPLQANVQTSMDLAIDPCAPVAPVTTTLPPQKNCTAPPGFCATGNLSFVDCDWDGTPDPYCESGNSCSCIGSSNKCMTTKSKCISGQLHCQRPKGWCSGANFAFSFRDCDADGMPDPFCQKRDSKKGEKSCGCLQSGNKCWNNYPAYCPDLYVPPVNMLYRTDEEFPIKSTVSGTLMYTLGKKGDSVSAGDPLLCVVGGSGIDCVNAPYDGVLTDLIGAYPGDKIYKGQSLGVGKRTVTTPPATLAPTPVPTPAPTPAPTPGATPVPTPPPTLAPTPVPTPAPRPDAEKGLKLPRGPLPKGSGGFPEFGTGRLPGGYEVPNLPSGGYLVSWETHVGDKIKKGGPIAKFEKLQKPWKPFTANYSGPTGQVFARQNTLPSGGLAAATGSNSADLISVGRGEFARYKVSPLGKVAKGDTICTLNVGSEKDAITVPASTAGVAVALAPYKAGDEIGFQIPMEESSFAMIRQPLPAIPGVNGSNISTYDGGAWLQHKQYFVGLEDQVEAGDAISRGIIVHTDGTTGAEVNTTACCDGYVELLQDISPGDFIQPGADLARIGAPEGSSFPWWLLLLVLLCCLLCCCLLCCRKKEPTPLPEQTYLVDKYVEPPPPVVENPVVEEPPPAPAPPRPPPPAPVPVKRDEPKNRFFFDGQPYDMEYQPFGFKFPTRLPIKIEDFTFNSYARMDKKLKKGQVLTQIANTDLSGETHISRVEHMMYEAEKDLPYWPLRVDFKTQQGQEKTYLFKERPLGIVFTRHLPIKVDYFRAHALAQRAGVQKGWEITRISDEDVSAIQDKKSTFDTVNGWLHEGLKHLPPWAVIFHFNANGATKRVQMDHKPIGIKFSKNAPFKVEGFEGSSSAQQKGVEVGWELLKVGDEDHIIGLSNMTHSQVAKEIKEYSEHLPEIGQEMAHKH